MSATSEVAATPTAAVATNATRTGEIDEKTETRRQGGGKVVALPARAVASAPSPGGSEVAQSVLTAYCDAMAEAGTPVVTAEALLPGIRAALRAGYSPRSVLIGLGMWESEGFRSPRQIEEWGPEGREARARALAPPERP